MKVALAIISIIVCLWANAHHNSIRLYAEINIPQYMRNRLLMIIFTVLSFGTVASDFIALFCLDWYWCILIAIPSFFILFFLFTLLFEVITQANYNYVSGGTGFSVWSKLFLAIVLAIIANLI